MNIQKKKTILLVEDEVIIAFAEAQIIKSFGYEVITVNSGKEAVNIAINNQNVQLIVMDINLGEGIDGTDAAQQILAKRMIPILFLTSHSEQEMVERVRGITRYGYVLKNSGDFVLRSSIEMAFGLFEVLNEMKAKEAALRVSQERFREVLENSLDTSYKRNLLTDTYDYLSPVFERISGYTPDEFTHLPVEIVLELIHPDDLAQVKSVIAESISGTEDTHYQVDYRFKHKNGQYRWFHDQFVIVRDAQGKPTAQIGAVSDITERKRAENDWIQSEARLSEAQAVAKIGSWETDLSNLQVIWSKETYRIFELDPNRFHGSHPAFLEFVHPEDHAKVDGAFVGSIEKDSYNTIEHRIITAAGNIKFVEERWRIFHNDQGMPIRAVGTCQDITERKATEEKLLKAYDRLGLATRAAALGIWDWDIQKNELVWDDQMFELYGVKKSDFSGAYEAWLSGIHPDDRAISDEISRQAQLGSGEYDSAFRIVWPDGTIRMIKAYGKVFKDNAGNPLRMIGINYDITESSQAYARIKSLLAEKELILKEVHHRIKNNMATITSLLSIQAETIKNPAVTAALNDAKNRVQSMLVLYNKLYLSDDFNKVSVKKYIPDLVNQIESNFSSHRPMKIDYQIDEFDLDPKKLFSVGIIVNEIITNILKHAFPGQDQGFIWVSVTLKNDQVSLIIRDNGIGIPKSINFENSPGFGLTLIEMLSRQIDGSVRIDRENGTKIILEFLI